ncbi:MAG TPA: hypothetical protein DF383_09955, partial [Deltaproteobacteria bacterium]|nr:hypothetical protein [Deltaproteobacteria bacterium]
MKKNLCFLILSVLLMMGSVLPVEAAVFNVTKTEDTNDGACDADCSLREAVLACNAAADDTNEIHIPAGTYVLIIGGRGEEIGETGDLDLNISSNGTPLAGKTIILQGAGNKLTIIDANHIDRAIGIHGGNAEIAGVTIRNGQADEFVGFDGIGGAIESVATGRVVLRQSNFEKNRAHDAAGGILIFGADRVEITECNFLDNRAEGNPNTFGGGLSIWDVREAVIGQSLFFKNWASNVGGGIDVFDQGGVGFDGGTTHILNSTISGNFAALGGGGLSNWTSHVNISFSTLQGNEVEAGPFASGANLWSNIFPIELKGTI